MSEVTKALIKAKANFGKIKRKAEVKVRTRTGGEYTFKYAPMEELIEATQKPLADEGLVVVQLRDGEHLITQLRHESGETLESKTILRIGDGASQQDEGSIRSYQERYNYAGILGLCATDDDDANIADGNEVERKPAKKQKPPHERFKDKVNALAEKLGDEKTSVILLTVAETENLDEIKDVQTMKDVVSELERNVKKEEK